MISPLRIGLFGIGLADYWPQFPGLEQRLLDYLTKVRTRLVTYGSEIVDLGLVDTTDKAFSAGSRCRREEVDILFLYVTTYALSGTVLPVVQRAGVPVIVLNLAPEPAIDYAFFNALGNRTTMTVGVACLLRRLSGTGDRQCVSASRDSVSPSNRSLGKRPCRLDRD